MKTYGGVDAQIRVFLTLVQFSNLFLHKPSSNSVRTILALCKVGIILNLLHILIKIGMKFNLNLF
jgi:hypothetical protein